MAETQERTRPRLTEACWPVLEFVTNFVRQMKQETVPAPEQVRYEALSALRDAEDLVREEPVAERAWQDRVKAMMVYLIDYKMINTEWDGRDYWFDHRFETDPEVLNEPEALGGEKFFDECDRLQKEFEVAERRERRDRDELAEQLGLYFTCLRLGFKGKYHDRPQELADYTRRLFSRLPAYGTTRGKEMFPEAYRHNQEVKTNYKLGMKLSVVVLAFATVVVFTLVLFRTAWTGAIAEIGKASGTWEKRVPSAPAPGTAGAAAGTTTQPAGEAAP